MVRCKTFFRAALREIFYTQEKKIVNSRATVAKIRENNEEKKRCTCVLKQVRLLELRGEMLGTCNELVTQRIKVSNECVFRMEIRISRSRCINKNKSFLSQNTFEYSMHLLILIIM